MRPDTERPRVAGSFDVPQGGRCVGLKPGLGSIRERTQSWKGLSSFRLRNMRWQVLRTCAQSSLSLSWYEPS